MGLASLQRQLELCTRCPAFRILDLSSQQRQDAIIARRPRTIAEILSSMAFVYFLIGVCMLTSGTMAQDPEEGYSREQLQPLTQFRQGWRLPVAFTLQLR